MNTLLLVLIVLLFSGCSTKKSLQEAFRNPPPTSFPGVYWYFMDGNLNRNEMTKDLESMKAVGINNLIFLEVDVGVPRGPVKFMSEQWQNLFVHAVREAERLGIRIRMGTGPGWCGSGGPWVEPQESMKHLVFSETDIEGNKKIDINIPVPEQRSTRWHQMKSPYYEDIAIYAIPNTAKLIENINEKALYERDPYSSKPKVKSHLPAPAQHEEPASYKILQPKDIMNVSMYLQDDGRLVWDAPPGNWTIVRMGVRVTGASTRPAPKPAIGLESDKLNSRSFENHLKNYTDILLDKTSPRKEGVGWIGFHMDSWESGAQNWTEGFAEEFIKRRGYDPEPYFLTYTGRIIASAEISERFLWDLRKTCQELLLENHAGFAKKYAHKNGLELTIEPYDMNPAGDLDLGAVADVIMAEFWSKRFGFHTAYAVLEATSISHITGQPIVGAEAFTSNGREVWQEYPWSMKDQSDWALALGVNNFIFHTFAHKPLGDDHRPGMTMGPYGVHWDRGQTWWPMVGAYHKYISRCSFMMQQGQAVSDILYLTPEGAPMVFTPPADALKENGAIPDKKGYGFDGCSPLMLIERADVEEGKIVFPGASSYEIMVLPNFKTMTPELLEKITLLVEKGAKIIGIPPLKSPGLSGYPDCDNQVKTMAKKLWGDLKAPAQMSKRKYGKGLIYWGGELYKESSDSTLYPSYKSTTDILTGMKIEADFVSKNDKIRFGHRRMRDMDIYFIANRTAEYHKTECRFRAEGEPQLWIGTSGDTRKISNYTSKNGRTTIPLEFYPYESFFITFSGKSQGTITRKGKANFPTFSGLKTIEGSWDVTFDPKFGGPESIVFNKLQDWTQHEMRGVRYYSGIATYKKTFSMNRIENGNTKYYIDLGMVNDIARVKLNGKDLGVIWCAPWKVEISGALAEGKNILEIAVANRWINRLLGDQEAPDAHVRKLKFENGLMGDKAYSAGRYTFTTSNVLRGLSLIKQPLPSGLLGPIRIEKAEDDILNNDYKGVEHLNIIEFLTHFK